MSAEAGDSAPTVAAMVARHLKRAGVRHSFVYPGDPIIDLLEEMRREELDVVLARREASAAFMAEGQAMRTGRLGVCVSTLGPGSTALVNGVAAATLDRVPMLAISGQIERSREQFFTHQVVDHRALYSPVTKWAGTLEPASACTIMRKALRLATAERPGAVHLTGGGDVFASPAGEAEVAALPSVVGGAPLALDAGGDVPLASLRHARRPVILAGIGAVRAEATKALVELAESASAPVVVAPMAKGVFPESHPMFAGTLDMACDQVVWKFVASADLIVTAGFDAVELIRPWTMRLPVLHIDSLANTDQIYYAAEELIGNLTWGVEAVTSAWRGRGFWSEAEVAAHRSNLRNAYYLGREAGKLNPTDVVDIVGAAVPAGTVITCDVGSHKLLVGQGWRAEEPRSVLMTNGLSSMGFGIPGAIGAQLVDDRCSVVAFVGDGGFAMAATELRLAVELKLPLVVVVMIDGSLNRIELKQMQRGYPSTATRMAEMDVAAMVEAMGCDATRVVTAAELEEAMTDATQRSRPLVIEARIDPAQYESQF
ncbi:MAG: thiamine pyrophosphate-binding protein [Actinomycetota bacterium]|nr:thiamine pyrophosphate-binding protein [Actinomycetota bacterium]